MLILSKFDRAYQVFLHESVSLLKIVSILFIILGTVGYKIMTFGIEIFITEIIGIIAFAISGAIVGIKKHFDIFGIIVLGVITAVGGGALRDITLGIIPPTM